MFRLTTTQSHEPMGDWWLKAMDQVIASVPMGRRERCVSGQDDLQRPTRSPNALQRPRQAHQEQRRSRSLERAAVS